MKKLLLLQALVFSILCMDPSANAQNVLGKLKDKAKSKVSQRADEKIDRTMDKTLDEAENAAKSNRENPENKNEGKDQKNDSQKNAETKQVTKTDSQPSLKVYQNYDFIPGDKILFEDNFLDDQDGEFPAHWELKAGQAILNKVSGELVMHLTDGNYARVIPRMKNKKYLSDPYTIEFDWYRLPGAYGVGLMMGFTNKEGEESEAHISIQHDAISFSNGAGDVSLSKNYPGDIHNNIDNKWHHVAIAFKNNQVKIYLDQNRILVVPDAREVYDNVTFVGIGSEEVPVLFKNVRIASGGNMNMIGKKFTAAKIVTHGINFDVNKASIRPESMGTLNMIVQVMKDNPEIKFEVGGHTDGDGADEYNLKLSQQRAEAVKDQLIRLGIDISRLTAKGYGETKPVSDNSTLEGKANNRRVEFVVQK